MLPQPASSNSGGKIMAEVVDGGASGRPGHSGKSMAVDAGLAQDEGGLSSDPVMDAIDPVKKKTDE
jgi:hypothetical protein